MSNLVSLAKGLDPDNDFFSMSLERPGSTTVPSRLGIGLHPAELVPDPARIKYVALSGSVASPTHWRVSIDAVTAYLDSGPQTITLGRSVVPGNTLPVGIFDSGGPNMLASTAICNAFYGAWGAGPAADGMCQLLLLFAIEETSSLYMISRLRQLCNGDERYFFHRRSRVPYPSYRLVLPNSKWGEILRRSAPSSEWYRCRRLVS